MTSRRPQGELVLRPGTTVGSSNGYWMALVVSILMQSHHRLGGGCCGWPLGAGTTASKYRSWSASRTTSQRWFCAPPQPKQLQLPSRPASENEALLPIVVPFPRDVTTADVHNHFMQLALEQAHQAARLGEVPIGALVVRNVTTTPANNNKGVMLVPKTNVSNNSTEAASTTIPPLQDQQQHYEILAAQHNRVETWHDASAHAELLALQQAGRVLRNWRLQPNVTLYSTLEPCPLCLSSVLQFRVAHVVYGAIDHRLGAVQTYAPLLELLPPHPFHTLTSVTGGVRAVECGALLREFFQQRRRQPPQPPLQEEKEQEEEP